MNLNKNANCSICVTVLQLSSVNLPGGELRRRSAEDELSMRNYLQEGDLVRINLIICVNLSLKQIST